MSADTLTPLMEAVLGILADGGQLTPNVIGYRLPEHLRIRNKTTGGPVKTSRGPAIRVMGPGSLIAPVLTALRRRGLIEWTQRLDGMSGTAYVITREGRAHRQIPRGFLEAGGRVDPERGPVGGSHVGVGVITDEVACPWCPANHGEQCYTMNAARPLERMIGPRAHLARTKPKVDDR